jgi:acyl-CoA thioester hydrolase
MQGERVTDPVHVTEVRVRWSECDPAGIVYFANYFTYFELGTFDYLRRRSADWRAICRRFGFVGFPRVEAFARYRAPARFDDLLAVHTRVREVARKVITFECHVYRQPEGALLAEGYLKIAPTNAEGRAALIPPALAAWLQGGPPPPEAAGAASGELEEAGPPTPPAALPDRR